MKKMFSMILALALILTIMPMPGGHNHALAVEAKGDPCINCDDCETGFAPPSWIASVPNMWGSTKCTTCNCMGKYHKVLEVECEYEYSYTVDPTCMHGGYESWDCVSNCGTNHWDHREEKAIDPNAHNFVNGFCVNKNEDETETCTAHQCKWENGVCVRVAGCTEKHAHTDDNFKLDVDSVVDPTCNSYGGYDLVCDVCGEVKHVDGTEYDSDNHSWNPDGTCANGCTVTCAHPSYKDGECEVCSCPHVHADTDWEKVEESYVAATCVKADTWTEKCKTCGATKDCSGEVDLVNGHKWLSNGMCDNTGCEAACDHNWDKGVCTKCTMSCDHEETHNEKTKDATCTKEGTADVVCDECKTVVGEAPVAIDPAAHDWIEFSFGAGFCRLCGAVSTDDSLFEDDEPTVEPTDKPTCPDNDHSWVEFSFGGWYCYKCGATSNDIKPIEPERCDHSDTYLETVEAATCKTEGTAKEICDICETILDENVVLPVDPDAHDWIVFSFGAGFCRLCSHISVDDSLFEEPEDPKDSCEHNWLNVGPGWFCSNCGSITTDESVVNPPVEEPEEPKEPCDHEWAHFSFGGWYCYKCGATATDIGPLDPDICDHDDTYIDVITPATCKEPGVGNKMCDICESLLEENVEIPVDTENGHKWTTDAEGNEYCELCGEAAPEKPVETPCDHNWLPVGPGWFCSKCGEIVLDDPNAVILGDINMDGVVDGRDEVRLMKHLAGQDVEINLVAADVNEDGTIDGRDEVRLLKILADM